MYSSTSFTNYFSSLLGATTTTTAKTADPAKEKQHDSTPIPKSFIISTPEEKIIRINMKSVRLKADDGNSKSNAKGKDNGNNGKDGVDTSAGAAETEVDGDDEDFISINKRQLTYAEVASIAVKLGRK